MKKISRRRFVEGTSAGIVAVAAIAADLGAGEIQVIAQQLRQCPAILYFHPPINAVNVDTDRGSGNGRQIDRWR